MFGNNAFGALGVESNQQAGPSRKQVQGDEIDVDWLQLVKTNHDVNVRVSDKVSLEGLPLECNLMVVSNRYGLLIVGSNTDVRIHRLKDVHKLLEESAKDASPVSEPSLKIPLPGRPVWVRLAAEETKLVVTTTSPATAQAFSLSDIMAGNTTASVSVNNGFPEQVLDVLPNPAPPSTSDALSRNTAVVTGQGLALLDIEEGKLTAPIQGQLTCASWSAKGKQIVCGERSGKLVQYTPDGTAKAEILPPPELASDFYPTSIEWLENDLFLVSYKNANGDEDEPLSVFIIHRNKEEVTYTEFFDPLNTMVLPNRSASYRSVSSLKQWGDQTRHLAFMLSGKSSEVAVMRGKPAAGKEAPAWESLILEETARGVMPTGKTGVSEDSSCIGLELDLTSTKAIKMGIVGGIEVPDLPPAPRLLAYSQEGFIISFDIRYPDAGAYPNMITPQETVPSAFAAEDSMETSAPAAVEPAPPAKPAFGAATQSSFGSSSSPSPSPSAFGSTAPSSGFGQSAFGKSSASPGFGQSAFGQPAAKSPFGQSSTPAFGQTEFGQKTETKSAFGSTTPASTSPFGQPAATSAFGQPSSGSTSAFGKPAFGASSTPAFGQTAFGAPSPSASPAFGASAFGAPSTPAKSPFGQTQAQGSTTPSSTPPASAPAFGQTAFGQKPTTSASTPAFGQTSTPQPSAFGQTAFGQPSKPSAFGQPASSTSSAFGSVPSTGGFAGFGAAAKSGSGSGFGQSAFGQPKPKPTDASSDSPFGSGGAVKTGSGSGSAFGSSSGFGQSAFGSKPTTSTNPFGKPAEKVEPKKDAPVSGSSTPTTTTADMGGFGLGGLGSALASKPTPATGSSGPGSDSLFAPSAKIAQDPSITSPPDSPVLGASKATGLDDDSPPPTPKPTQPKSQSTTTGTGASSSFIKPATAFGTTFGQSTTPASTPIKPTSSTPNAFSQPVSTTSSSTPSASGFGSTGFGSSAFGKPSTPGFGGSTFGKPPSVTPVGNITGGFGGFAAKSPSSTSAFSGFGGAKSTSAFGSTASGSGGTFASLLSGDKDKPKESEKPVSPPADSTPPAKAEKEVSKVEVKEEPRDMEESSEEPPTPKGYDVPLSTPAPPPGEAVKPAEEKGEEAEEDVKPDISSDKTNAGTTTPPTNETEAEVEEPESTDDRAGSSPEIVKHADSEEHEDDYERDHEEEDEDGEEYDEGEGEEEGEYEEGDEDNYDDEEEYDEDEDEQEESYEDEREGEGEGEGGEEKETEEEQQPVDKPPAPTDQTPGSLFSRLAPPSNPSFFGRHAARTSSPLGTQPPQNAEAESSTPPGTPPTKSAAPARDASTSAPPPFFGFNKPQSQPAPEIKAPTPIAFGSENKQSSLPSFGAGAGFGKLTSDHAGPTSLSQTSTGTTPAQPPAPKVEEKQPEKSLFSGFGLGRPSAPAQSQAQTPSQSTAAASKPVFSFGNTGTPPASALSTTTPQPPASTPSPSLFGQKPQPALSTPAAPTVKPVADGKFAIPARTPAKESPQAKDDGSRQMAAVMQRMVTDLISEIKTMKEALATHAEYHRGLEPKFNKVSLEDLDGHNELPFSSISDIATIIDQLSAEMSGMKQKDKSAELRVMELQSRMLKTDMKVKQVEKLVQAHDDATYAYHSRNQDLSPRQLNSRVQIRKRTQSVESKLEDLDRSVRKLKQSETDGQPTIETLQSSLREVETAIADKQDMIEDLSMRVKSIRLSTPSSRRTSYLPPARQSSMAPRNKISTLDIPVDISDEVSRLIDREDKKIVIKSKVARLTRASSATGAIRIVDLPSGKIDISSFIRQDEPQVKEEPDAKVSTPTLDSRTKSESSSTPQAPKDQKSADTQSALPPAFNLSPDPNSTSGTTSSPSPSFGGFTLSLNPGDLSSSHSRQRTTTGGTRTHHAAPRVNLVASPSPLGEGTSSPTTPASFFPPPNGATSGGNGDKGGPKGFFSLSGFGQK